jgi:hypothetical protein
MAAITIAKSGMIMTIARRQRHRHRSDGLEGVAEVDVLVLLLDQLVARRRHDLHDVLAGRDAGKAYRRRRRPGPDLLEVADSVEARSCHREVSVTKGHPRPRLRSP